MNDPLPQTIYMDHAATTPVAPAVLEAMLPYLKHSFGNASSVHRPGREARGALEDSRGRIAAHLNTKPEQIIFTSGATEANNLGLSILRTGEHLITSKIEHKAVLEPAEALKTADIHTTFLAPAPETGSLHSSQVAAAVRPDTRLVSVMYVNNETGAISPLGKIASVCHEHEILLHTDAAQAAAWLPLDKETLGTDLLSLSAHKIYGPKGIGILYVREGVELPSQILGGSQERGRRGGTENIAGAVGMATAMDLVAKTQSADTRRVHALRKELQDQLLAKIGDRLIVNTPVHAAPHILNVAFKPMDGTPLDGEMLLLNLDIEGVYASAGSACTSGAISPSHVLLGLGLPEHTARAALRLSLGRTTTKEEVKRTADCICRVVKRMREQRKADG